MPQRKPLEQKGGVSAEARGDIRTAGSVSRVAQTWPRQGQCQEVGGAELGRQS